MERELILAAHKVCKAFGPTRALIDVDVEVRKGEIRGLIGENGSGKSTFCSIVAGALEMDSGELELHGEKYEVKSMVEAQNHGVAMIVQEAATFPGLDVASNIFAGRLEQYTKCGFLDWNTIYAEADRILEDIGVPEIKGRMNIEQLNFEDRKIVEIARAMVNKPEILIIDETTTALATKGRKLIYALIERMHKENKAVLFISHDLDELMERCNTITVLRDGLIIDTLDRENMSIERMRSLMIGRELQGDYYRPDFDGNCSEEVLLKAEQVTLRPYFKNIDVTLHKGEILGFGGLSNCGMHELGRLLFGLEKPLTGSVTLYKDGEPIQITSPSVAVDRGMAYVSKDRDKESIVLQASIQSNILMPALKGLSGALGFISPAKERALTNQQIKVMSIKCRNGSQLVKELSGGNKQKVVFSKWLGTDCDVFILDCPTRGIDVGVKADMYKLIMELKRQGKGIIMISEELLELIGMSDRMMIFKDGKVSKEFARSADLKENDIIEYII